MSETGLEAARRLAARRDPFAAAQACGVVFEGDEQRGEFVVPFMGTELRVSYPGFACEEVPPHVLALVVYHLALSDGTEPSGRWVSFAELPDGGFYVQAFRGYAASAVVRRFAADRGPLETAARSLDAAPLAGLADAAWSVPALPRIPVALLWWDGDEEFGPRAEFLFDESASRHLQTDGLAVLGSWITAMLARAAGSGPH